MSILQNFENVDWEFLKSNIFDQDGSYRDVYIEKMNTEKWYKLVDYFFTKKLIRYSHIYIEESDTNYYEMPENWKELLEKTKTTWLFNVKFLSGTVGFHHFIAEQIEATINPLDIQNMKDFHKLIEFLDDVVRILDLGRWYITPENCQEDILIERIVSQNKTHVRM